MEMRLFRRMRMPIPMRYCINISEPSERLWIGQGVLKNISVGGAYFTCEDNVQLDMGHSGTFTITNIYPSPAFPVDSDIVFKGLVKRIEPPSEKSAGFGVGVQLLSHIEVVLKDQNPPSAPANSNG